MRDGGRRFRRPQYSAASIIVQEEDVLRFSRYHQSAVVKIEEYDNFFEDDNEDGLGYDDEEPEDDIAAVSKSKSHGWKVQGKKMYDDVQKAELLEEIKRTWPQLVQEDKLDIGITVEMEDIRHAIVILLQRVLSSRKKDKATINELEANLVEFNSLYNLEAALVCGTPSSLNDEVLGVDVTRHSNGTPWLDKQQKAIPTYARWRTIIVDEAQTMPADLIMVALRTKSTANLALFGDIYQPGPYNPTFMVNEDDDEDDQGANKGKSPSVDGKKITPTPSLLHTLLTGLRLAISDFEVQLQISPKLNPHLQTSAFDNLEQLPSSVAYLIPFNTSMQL